MSSRNDYLSCPSYKHTLGRYGTCLGSATNTIDLAPSAASCVPGRLSAKSHSVISNFRNTEQLSTTPGSCQRCPSAHRGITRHLLANLAMVAGSVFELLNLALRSTNRIVSVFIMIACRLLTTTDMSGGGAPFGAMSCRYQHNMPSRPPTEAMHLPRFPQDIH